MYSHFALIFIALHYKATIFQTYLLEEACPYLYIYSAMIFLFSDFTYASPITKHVPLQILSSQGLRENVERSGPGKVPYDLKWGNKFFNNHNISHYA